MYYLYAKDPVFHQLAYGGLTLATTIRGFLATHHELKPALRRRVPAESEAYIRQIQQLSVTGELTIWGPCQYCANSIGVQASTCLSVAFFSGTWTPSFATT